MPPSGADRQTQSPASGPSQADVDKGLAKAEEHFADLKKALGEFHARFPTALSATIQEERLREASKGSATNWRCAAELRKATDQGNSTRGELAAAMLRSENRWKAVKDTVRRLPEASRAQLSWMKHEAAIAASLRRGNTLKSMVGSPSAKKLNESHLATLWARAQEYAKELPECLPAIKAERLVPDVVNVPCISQAVYPRK